MNNRIFGTIIGLLLVIVGSIGIGIWIATYTPPDSWDMPDLQTSEFRWAGPIDETYLEFMCDKHDIDYHMVRPTQGYRVECPKCEPGVCDPNGDEDSGGAFFESWADGSGKSVIFRFLAMWPEIEELKAGESMLLDEEDSRVYCSVCGWPVGTDLRVIDLDKSKKQYTFDDLLDAIEQVESGGDSNAVGDNLYFSTWNDANDFRAGANDCIYLDFGGIVFDANSEIIVEDIETTPDGKIKIYIPQAIGAYQLTKIYVDDVNRIIRMQTDDIVGNHNYLPSKRFTYKDRWDRAESRIMTSIYLVHYTDLLEVSNWDKYLECAARIHNGGPNGWKKDSTKPYWEKIRKEMEK